MDFVLGCIVGAIIGVVIIMVITALIASSDAYGNKGLSESDLKFNNCQYYDKENGWCKCFSNFDGDTPNIAYCSKGPCPCYQSTGRQIEAEAKYNIGDEIWFAEYVYDTYYPCQYPGTICEIGVKITKHQQSIKYSVRTNYGNNIGYAEYAEKACFASYEECEQWCEEYNS